ncbi:acyltransferase [Steroidobacter sp. S1-65]|uniref:Acyltransferase n=1 Tax=Steroidobacter gossypii TaxID=2805490 RepID=A0ABS1X3J5_9GAMM|nr:acyltransferase family protein [Steroidobacter gossypii]MBM0107796.1 acyltransferase [Steroidobacter gossypii]
MRPDIPSAGHAKHFQYRAAVDGLRGVAVLAVLGFHAFPETVSGGYVGVDVFFVISGFLITGIIARQLLHADFSFVDFYWRRVRRLFPALVLVLATTLVLGWFLLLPHEFKQLGKHVGAAAAFLANFAFWRESGYFDTAAEFKPLLHLWSLGIEEQFYLVWPAVLVAFWKRRTTLLVILWTLVLASFALSVHLAQASPVTNFYWPVSRFWELGAGCLLALLMEGRTRTAPTEDERRFLDVGYNLLPAAGLALILASIMELDESTPFPSWPALLPVVGALLILATPEHVWLQRKVLGSRPLVWTGLISYALYLWHWPLLAFLNILSAGTPPAAIRWMALGAGFLLAGLTYHYVEIPIRKHKEWKFNIRLAASAVAAGLAGVIIYAAGGVAQRFDADIQALRHGPRLDRSCYARFGPAAPINYCRSTSAEPPSILFIGDSRAHAIYEAAAPMFAAEHSVMLLGRGGCPPLLHVRISGYDPNEADCPQVWRTFVDYVHKTKPKVVVVVGNGSFLITDPNIRLIREGAPTRESKEAIFEHGIRSLLSELVQTTRVIYLGEIPRFATGPSCFLRAVRLPTTQCHPERDREQVERAMAPYNRVLARVQTTYPDIQLVDSIGVLCADNVCSQRPPGKPLLYSDAVHLSSAGARLLIDNTRLTQLISRDMLKADSG